MKRHHLFFIPFLLSPALGQAGMVVRAQGLMGTVLEISAEGPNQKNLDASVQDAFDAVRSLEDKWTLFRNDSELSVINKNAFLNPVPVSTDTIAALKEAKRQWKRTQGHFDPTAVSSHPLKIGINLPPGSIEKRALKDIKISPRKKTVFFKSPMVRLDLDGIAKGIALDQAAAILKEAGAVYARLNFGGQILLFGGNDNERPALIQVGNPEDPHGALLSLVLKDGSISTSNQKQPWNKDEGPSQHIQNPLTGSPAEFSGSASVIGSSGAEADALSTALISMGPDAGLKWADKNNICAIFTQKNNNDKWTVNAADACPAIVFNQQGD